MEGRPKTRAAVLALAVVAASTSAAFTTLAAPGPAPRDSGEQNDVYRWEAPTDLNGTLIVSLAVEVDKTTWCEADTVASGRFDPDNAVGFWASTSEEGRIRTSSAGSWSRGVQAHAGDTVDTRDLSTPEGRWRQSPSMGLRVSEGFTYTFAGFGLEAWEGAPDGPPYTVEITCDDGFHVTEKKAGRDGRSFKQETLEGGVGASVYVPTQTVSASRDDGLAHTFDTSTVRFESTFSPGTNHGELTLDHPAGTARWQIGRDGPRQATHTGGPGTYAVELDWVAEDGRGHPMGILVGMDPVDALEEAVS